MKKCSFTLRTHIWTLPFLLFISFTSFPMVWKTMPSPCHSSSLSTFSVTRAPLTPIAPGSKSSFRTFGYIFINSANLVFFFIIPVAFLTAIFWICFYWSAPIKYITLGKGMAMELDKIYISPESYNEILEYHVPINACVRILAKFPYHVLSGRIFAVPTTLFGTRNSISCF